MAAKQQDSIREVRAARVRAARAHADLDQSAIGDALGKSVYTVKRLERGQREITDAELAIVARVCGVPYSFLIRGFSDDPINTNETEPATVRVVERAVETLSGRIAELEQLLAGGVSGETGERVRAELGRNND